MLPPVDAHALTELPTGSAPSLTSAAAAALVDAARARQFARQRCLNAQLGPGQTLKFCRADGGGMQLLGQAAQKRGCSARSQHRILRVARTIADLDDRESVGANEIAEALSLRWAD